MLTRRQFSARLAAGGAAMLTMAGAGSGRAEPEARHGPGSEITTGLLFPEGPVAFADGSVVVSEIARGTITRVFADGRQEIVARPGGGPNGAALGPDGAYYVCNGGGGRFETINGLLYPVGPADPPTPSRIEKIDLKTGAVAVLYDHFEGAPLGAPNDLVFDASGGFWFTDTGKDLGQGRGHGGIYYARADGAPIKRVAFPLISPNGIGLSPDGKMLYVADLLSAQLLAFDIVGDGVLAPVDGPLPGRLVAALPKRVFFDSLALEANGTICIATPLAGQITRISPDGVIAPPVKVPGPLPTNICFGGPDLRTAFITLSGTGKLISMDWKRPGLRLNFPA